MKTHRCQDCGETDPTKFKGSMKGRCYNCHKKLYHEYYRRDKSEEKHFCLNCGETTPHNFFPNSKSRCKKCTYDPKRKLNKLKRIKQAKPPAIKLARLPNFTCRTCGKTGETNFYKSSPFLCIDCFRKQMTRYYYPFYDQLVAVQGEEVCCLCKKKPQEIGQHRLCVDHDHETNLVRGLLCSVCNRRIGQFTSEFGKRALAYLTNYPAASLNIQFPERMKKKS
jgi:Recombination endonuclease VII